MKVHRQGRSEKISQMRKIFLLLLLLIFAPSTSLITSFSFAAEAQKAESEVLTAQGVVAYDEHRYEDALRLFEQARSINPQHERTLYYLGLTRLALKQPEQAVVALEAARQLQPSDAAIGRQLGIAHFAAGRYNEAAPLLEQAFKTDPSTENLGYYVGLGRYRQKNYQGAIDAFNATKTSDPNVQQLVRFYRGLALGVLGMPEQASAELRQVQTSTSLPFTGQAMQIQQSLARKVQEDKRLNLQVSVGGYYNDNVAINPTNSGTTPDPATNAILSSLYSRDTQSPGVIASLAADYAFYRKGSFEGDINYSFLQTVNTNSAVNDFNLQSHLPGISGFYRSTMADIPFQLGAQYTYNYIFLGGAGFMSTHSPTFSATFVPPSLGSVGNLTSIVTRWQQKEFFREPVANDIRFASEERDGYNVMAGFIHAFRFVQDKHIVRVGFQYDNETTAGTAFSYKGYRGQAGLQYTLPLANLIARYDYDIHFRNYKNSQTLFTDFDGALVKREDTQQTHLVQLIYPFAEHWSVTAQYQGIFNNSNIPVYDYKQNVWTGLVTWTY